MTFPADPMPVSADALKEVKVEVARFAGFLADVVQNVEAQGKELDRQGHELSQVVESSKRGDEWRTHYSAKIDQMHRSLVGNGGPGILTRLAVNEGDVAHVKEIVAHVKEVLGIKVKSVKESSIDWKWLALFAVNALVVIILAATNLK